jgi:hypothetical protein
VGRSGDAVKILLALILLSRVSALAQTFVSYTNFEDNSATTYSSVTATFSSGVTTGNLVACFLRFGNLGTGSSVTAALSGTGGDTFSGTTTVDGNNTTGMFYKVNAAGNSSYVATATFTGGSPNYIAMVCGQYSGTATVSAFDQTAYGTATSGTCTTGTFTTTSANEVIIYGASGGPTWVPGGGMTLRGVSGPNSVVMLSDITVTSIQTGISESASGQLFALMECTVRTFIKASSSPMVPRSKHVIF